MRSHAEYERLLRCMTALALRLGLTTVAEVGVGPGHLTDALIAQGLRVIAVDRSPRQLHNLSHPASHLQTFQWDPTFDLPAPLLTKVEAVVSAFLLHNHPVARQADLISQWVTSSCRHTTIVGGIGHHSRAEWLKLGPFDPLPSGHDNYLFGGELTLALTESGITARWHQLSSFTGVLLASSEWGPVPQRRKHRATT